MAVRLRMLLALAGLVALFAPVFVRASRDKKLLYTGRNTDLTSPMSWLVNGAVPTNAPTEAAFASARMELKFDADKPGYLEFKSGTIHVGAEMELQNVEIALGNSPTLVFGDSGAGTYVLNTAPAKADCADHWTVTGAQLSLSDAAQAEVGAAYSGGNKDKNAQVMNSLLAHDEDLDLGGKPVRLMLGNAFFNLKTISGIACAEGVTISSCAGFMGLPEVTRTCVRQQLLDLCDVTNYPDTTTGVDKLKTYYGKWWFLGEPTNAAITDGEDGSNCELAGTEDYRTQQCFPTTSCPRDFQADVVSEEVQIAIDQELADQEAILRSWTYLRVVDFAVSDERASDACQAKVEAQLNRTFYHTDDSFTTLVDMEVSGSAGAYVARLQVFAPGDNWFSSWTQVPDAASVDVTMDGVNNPTPARLAIADAADPADATLAGKIVSAAIPALLHCDAEAAQLKVDQADDELDQAKGDCAGGCSSSQCDSAAGVAGNIAALPAASVTALAGFVATNPGETIPAATVCSGLSDTELSACEGHVDAINAVYGLCSAADNVVDKLVGKEEADNELDEANKNIPLVVWSEARLKLADDMPDVRKIRIFADKQSDINSRFKTQFEGTNRVRSLGHAFVDIKPRNVVRRRRAGNDQFDFFVQFNFSQLCQPSDTDCRNGVFDETDWTTFANTFVSPMAGEISPSMCRRSFDNFDLDLDCVYDAVLAECDTTLLSSSCVQNKKVDFVKCTPALYKDASSQECWIAIADNTDIENQVDWHLDPTTTTSTATTTTTTTATTTTTTTTATTSTSATTTTATTTSATTTTATTTTTTSPNITIIHLGSSTSGGSTSIIPIVGAVAGAAMLIVLAIIATKKGWIGGKPKRTPAAATGDRHVVAFENPMYDEPGKKKDDGDFGFAGDGGGEGLYDEPSFSGGSASAKNNPLYESTENLADDTYDNEGGYLDAEPNDEPNDEGGYLDVAPDE